MELHCQARITGYLIHDPKAIELAQKVPSDNASGILVTANLSMGNVDKANQAA